MNTNFIYRKGINFKQTLHTLMVFVYELNSLIYTTFHITLLVE